MLCFFAGRSRDDFDTAFQHIFRLVHDNTFRRRRGDK
jgi:hypothetical protein